MCNVYGLIIINSDVHRKRQLKETIQKTTLLQKVASPPKQN